MVGDELLRGMAARLQERLINRASVFRSGGDEFVVIIDGIGDQRSVVSVAMGVLPHGYSSSGEYRNPARSSELQRALVAALDKAIAIHHSPPLPSTCAASRRTA